MRLVKKLLPPSVNWESTHHPIEFLPHRDDKEALCGRTGVHQCVDIGKIRTLNEATYKEIASLIDGNFLQQKVRADVLKGIRFLNFQKNLMRFEIESSEFAENGIHYLCNIQFDDWDDITQDQDFNYIEKARLLLWTGDIRLHCTCPSFLYWGYQYLLHAIDAAIYPEDRPPNIRNPRQRGIVCKHLNRILRALPFYSGEIAKGLKDQYSIGDEGEDDGETDLVA